MDWSNALRYALFADFWGPGPLTWRGNQRLQGGSPGYSRSWPLATTTPRPEILTVLG
jgi:hypothetical protein